MRCHHVGMLIVGFNDRTWEDKRLCIASCARVPWSCPKCDGARVPQHTSWCTVAHPEFRARWLLQLSLHRHYVRAYLDEWNGDLDLIDEDPVDDDGALDDLRGATE